MTTLKDRVYEVIEQPTPGKRVGRIVEMSITALIYASVASMVLGTVEEIHSISPAAFDAFEAFSVGVFSIEILARVWSSTSNERYSHPLWGRLRYLASPLTLIDLLAILPYYLAPLLSTVGVDFRALRLIRILARAARLSRGNSSIRIMGRVLYAKRNELMTVLSSLLLLLLLASTVMYLVEREAQPDKFGSIPESLWWGLITLTTVGYGDVYPVTITGRLITGMVAIMGIGLFALPAGILASGFSSEVNELHSGESGVICPHCGMEIGQ